MNLLRIGIRPATIYNDNYSGIFNILRSMMIMKCYIGELRENSFINTMTCIEALRMLNKALKLYDRSNEPQEHITTISSSMFQRNYIQLCNYGKTNIINVSYIPVSVLKFLYNQIYIAQDNSDKELFVSDIEIFNFGGI